MNKILKVTMIVSLILLLLGIILAAAGYAAGGHDKLSRMVAEGAFRPSVVSVMERDGSEDEMVFFDDQFPVLTEDFDKTLNGAYLQKLSGLTVEADGAGVYIKQSSDHSIRIKGENVSKTQYYMEDNVLHIKVCDREWGQDKPSSRLFLYLPEECSMEYTALNLGAGELQSESFSTDELYCEVGAGSAKLSGIQARLASLQMGMGEMVMEDSSLEDMDFEVGMGSFRYTGTILGNLSGVCCMGSASMELEGNEEEHNYYVDAGMGSVVIGDRTFEGVSTQVSLDNEVDSSFDLTGSMGTVEISFTNHE